MKLLIISTGALPLPPVKGGAVENLIDIFIQDNEEKGLHDITVISIHDENAVLATKAYKKCLFKYVNLDGVINKTNKVIRYAFNKLSIKYIGNLYINKVQKMNGLDWKSYDAVIIENAPEYGLVIRDLVRGKLILHLHNDYLDSNVRYSKEILDCYDKVFTLSNFVGNRVRSISKSSKIKTLYNGIDLKKFNKTSYNSAKIREKFGIANDDYVIMYSGRLVPEKGVAKLLDAIKLLDNIVNVKVIIAGSTRYGENVPTEYLSELLSKSSTLTNKVIFTGYISYEDMPQLYSVADIGIVPSLCNEGFNLTVVEFMANNIPVIASDRGALKELINSNCGIIVSSDENISSEIASAIKKLIEDEEKYNFMKEKAFEQSKLFSKENYCERFNFLLNE